MRSISRSKIWLSMLLPPLRIDAHSATTSTTSSTWGTDRDGSGFQRRPQVRRPPGQHRQHGGSRVNGRIIDGQSRQAP